MPKKKHNSDRSQEWSPPSALLATIVGSLPQTSQTRIGLPEVAEKPLMFTRAIPGSTGVPASVPVTAQLGKNPIFTRAIPGNSIKNVAPLPLDLGANLMFTRPIPSLSNSRMAVPSEVPSTIDLGVNPTFTRMIPDKSVPPSVLPPPVGSNLNPTFTRVLPTPVQLPPNSIFTRVPPASVVAEMRVFRDPGSVAHVPLGERPVFTRTLPQPTKSLVPPTATPRSAPDIVAEYPVLPPVIPPRLPPPMPPAYQFISPYVADHIICDDATFTGNKIFRPPPYSIYGEMRHLKTRTEELVSLVGRTSPPLDPRNFALDSLKSTSNFDPPMTFEYTRKHLEHVHKRIMSNSGRYDYLAMTEMLASTRRNQLQMEMRLEHILSIEQQELRAIRDLLEEQLDELDELELSE